MRQSMRRVAGIFKSKENPKFARHEYKAVWNSVSTSENGAKFAVSGFTDEATYEETGQQTFEMLRNAVGVNPDDVILEIGAGVGRVGAILAPVCREWIGVDVSENMVSHIKRRLGSHSNVRAVATSGYDLAPIPSNSIDMVYCTVVFMHLDEWDRYNYITEAFRVLKPGGRLLVDNINLMGEEGWAMFLSHCAIPPHERPVQISKTSTSQELNTFFLRAGFVDVVQKAGSMWVITYATKPHLE